jgi:hypothetical protein
VFGAFVVTALAPRRTQRQQQFRTGGVFAQRRLEQGTRRLELPLGAKQIAEIDQRFEPPRLLFEDAAKELRRGLVEAQGVGGIAQREQDAGIIGLGGQRGLETGNRLQVASLRGKFQALGIGLGIHDASLASSPLRAR